VGRGESENSGSKPGKANLGTFGGVFTPSILTILGIILFLRLGYVLGSAGTAHALIIIGVASAISVLTSISLSAIATNLKVKGGGDYYLISRTLGVEFGGALGIVLFLAQSVSVGFYCIGFGEALAAMFPDGARFSPQIIAALAVSLLFIFAWLGADWATRFQYVVMTLLAAALFSFFAGGLAKWDSAIFVQNWARPAGGLPFWTLFAIFFPAATGFTQGVSMSGDLKDAGKSLPLGTFFAVGISIVVYISVAFVFSGVLPGEVMMNDYGAMKRVALINFLIDAGVIAATLSSAMASFLGAPRILQSLASDRIFPLLVPFAKGFGPFGNPRRGVLLSAGIAFATIALGNLNVIAPVVSMFFLISYGLLNYATFYEARAASPSFRPRFRWFDLRLSLLGFLACLGVILAINLTAGIVAVALLLALYQYLKRTAGPARWADSRRSYHLQQVREHLLAASEEPEHPRDWRPQLLAFSDHPHRRNQLLRFASWIQGGSGLTTAVRILEGEGLKMIKLQAEAEEELRKHINEHGLKAFPLVIFAPNLQVGLQTLVQGFGIGPFRANTVLINWFEDPPKGVLSLKALTYGRNLRMAFRLGCNIVVLNADELEWSTLEALSPSKRRIDVWWWNDATSRLMLLLAYLITRSDEWAEARIRVLAASYEKKTTETIEHLQSTLKEVRIQAESQVVADASAKSIVEYSADAALVFLPFRLHGNNILGPFGGTLQDIFSRLSIVVSVLAAEDIELDAQPEEGKAGEVAAALDAVTDARKKAEEADKAAAKAAEEAREKIEALKAAKAAAADEKIIMEMDAAAREAKDLARKAARRGAKARAKAEDAGREAEALGVNLADEKDSSPQ
jgi:amino acid transporter